MDWSKCNWWLWHEGSMLTQPTKISRKSILYIHTVFITYTQPERYSIGAFTIYHLSVHNVSIDWSVNKSLRARACQSGEQTSLDNRILLKLKIDPNTIIPASHGPWKSSD